MTYLIIYLVMIPVAYYLIRRWVQNKYPNQETKWEDVFGRLICSVVWPVALPIAFSNTRTGKPPKWL